MQYLQECKQLIQLHWQNEAIEKIEISDFEMLMNWLTKEIQHLMHYDLEKLYQIMYRIDVDEFAFTEALRKQDAYQIAQLALQRELKKAETRAKYKADNQ